MTSQRGYGGAWEIRLGALQLVIWAGLAVGSLLGAYFVGFFSGRFVGFETARSASGVEVAKLSISEPFPEPKQGDPSSIYSQLDSPALLKAEPDSTADERVAALGSEHGVAERNPNLEKLAPERDGTAKGSERSLADLEARAVNGSADALKGSDSSKKLAGTLPKSGGSRDGAVAASDIDAMFDDSHSGNDALDAGDGLDADVADVKPASGVRVLGAKPSEPKQPEAKQPTKGAANDATLGAILDERVSRARLDNGAKKDDGHAILIDKNKPTSPKDGASAAKGTTQAEAQAPAANTNLVKQVLPNGYFAQVAAPKKLSEAEEVSKRLRRSGFPVVIETAHVRGEEYYRVLVGPEENKVQADRLVEQLKRESYLSGTAFIKRVR